MFAKNGIAIVQFFQSDEKLMIILKPLSLGNWREEIVRCKSLLVVIKNSGY